MATTKESEGMMATIRLQSLKGEKREGVTPMGIHTPGLIGWAKSRFNGKGSDPVVRIIAESFSLKREVALALLTGEVDYKVDGDDVVFDWPGDDPIVKEVSG
jgi:hypothetical protein